MSRGLGVVKYCTDEGGSGYMTNPSLPWLSSFDITQQSPVYDQNIGWMRNEGPRAFTNYQRFGPPYSRDGGVLPPFTGPVYDDHGEPIPYETGCGMGDVVLLRSDVVAPMPSITSTAREGCQLVNNCPGGDVATWIQENPWLAAGLALAGGFLLFGGGRR